MYEILSIEDFYFGYDQRGWFATIEAVIDDMVVVHPATMIDPPEMGPALCVGTLILDDYSLVRPIGLDEQLQLASEVDDWVISTGS